MDFFKKDEPAPATKESFDVVAAAKEIPAKVAGATADAIGAASEYGKLDKSKGAGKYAEQAEGYVRQFDTTPKPATPAEVAGDYVKKAGEYLSQPFGGDGAK